LVRGYLEDFHRLIGSHCRHSLQPSPSVPEASIVSNGLSDDTPKLLREVVMRLNLWMTLGVLCF
jgi:hypothetical protein